MYRATSTKNDPNPGIEAPVFNESLQQAALSKPSVLLKHHQKSKDQKHRIAADTQILKPFAKKIAIPQDTRHRLSYHISRSQANLDT